MLGIIFDEKHSFKDFNLTIKSKEIGFPSPKLVKDSVPFLQGEYDFSELYGDVAYDERKLKYVFNVVKKDKINTNLLKIQVANWLKTQRMKQLIDDAIVGYYFFAQCEDIDFGETGFIGEITVTFTAYPFKIRTESEGNLLWDNFCFDTDILQDTKFEVNSAKEIVLINDSARKISPIIKCTSDFILKLNNTNFKIKNGETQDSRFKLNKGKNTIVLNGTGIIEFIFYKEVL